MSGKRLSTLNERDHGVLVIKTELDEHWQTEPKHHERYSWRDGQLRGLLVAKWLNKEPLRWYGSLDGHAPIKSLQGQDGGFSKLGS